MILFQFYPSSLLSILYKLAKFEAPFWSILITKFHYDPSKGA